MIKKHLIVILSLLFILSSCGARYHLKRSEHHLAKAIAKGAIIKPDTVFIEKPVFIPEVKTDTIFKSKVGDTILISKDRLKIKYIHLPRDSIFIEGKCESDTVTVEVPVTVTKTIQAEHWFKWWYLVIAFLLGALMYFKK